MITFTKEDFDGEQTYTETRQIHEWNVAAQGRLERDGWIKQEA